MANPLGDMVLPTLLAASNTEQANFPGKLIPENAFLDVGSLFKKKASRKRISELPVHLPVGALDDKFREGEFYPQPDWPDIAAFADKQGAEFQDPAWRDIAWFWGHRLAEHLGESYDVHWSTEFLLLSPYPKRKAFRVLDMLERYRERLLSILAREGEGFGFWTVFIFENPEHYYRYVSAFGPEGARAGSGGMFLSNPYYSHLVTYDQQMMNLEVTLAHELTHYMLWPSHLPLWLEEGFCMCMESVLASAYYRPLTTELASEHRDYWSEIGLQGFWSGHSFSSVEGQEYSYELARILFQLLADRKEGTLPQFLTEADYRDAGFSACKAAFGERLDNIVGSFLGPGSWTPDFEELA